MKASKYLEKYGIEKNDIPKAIIYFKVTGYLSWFGTLAICYKYKPIRLFFRLSYPKHILNKIKNAYPQRYDKYENFIFSKSKKIAENRYFKKIPVTLGLKAKRFSYSLAENLLFYKCMLPIILPLQFYSAMLLFSHRNESILDNPIDEVPRIIKTSYEFSTNLNNGDIEEKK